MQARFANSISLIFSKMTLWVFRTGRLRRCSVCAAPISNKPATHIKNMLSRNLVWLLLGDKKRHRLVMGP
jgi:hypothetical protein